MAWVLRNSKATLGSRLVLLVLADYADEEGGSCWPSVKTIARETLLSERQVQYNLRHLAQIGEIAVEEEGGGRKSTRYKVCMGESPGVQYLHPSEPSNELRGATHCTPGVQPIAPDPLVEPPEEQTSLAAAPRARPRNPIWDTLTEVFGEPTTRSAQKVRGKVCSSLVAARASPAEILNRARRWPLHFDGATMTDLALEKHWDTLARQPLRRQQ
jgi:hypothetical protein